MITCGGGAGVAEQGGFINRGTYRFTEAGTLTLARGAWFKNHGTIRNDSHGSVSILNSVAEIAAFSNDTGAVVSSLGSNSVLLVRLQNIMDAGGTWLAMTNAEIRLDPVTVLAMSPNTVFQGDTASTGIVDIAGDWSINMTGVASGIVTFAQHNELRIVTNISLDLDASGASGGTTEGAVPGSVMWGGSGLGIDIEDSTLTLNTPVSLSGANAVLRSSGAPKSGILVNAVGNTFTHALAGSLTIRCADSGTVGVGFENRGTFVFATMNASVAAISHANVFRNVEGAAIRANAGSGNTAIFTGSGQLSNQGSLEVLSGTLDVASTIHYPQFESGALTGGVLDVNGTLDLNRGANIITIGTNAVVRLRGADTTFPELMGNLTTVNGTFGLHSGMVYNATGDLVVPGTIEFGLSDSDQSDVVVKTGISNAVNVTLTGGKVSVVDLGLSTPGTFTLIEFTGTRTGFLSMGAVPPNGLGYKLRHLDKMVQLSVSGGGGVILLFF